MKYEFSATLEVELSSGATLEQARFQLAAALGLIADQPQYAAAIAHSVASNEATTELVASITFTDTPAAQVEQFSEEIYGRAFELILSGKDTAVSQFYENSVRLQVLAS